MFSWGLSEYYRVPNRCQVVFWPECRAAQQASSLPIHFFCFFYGSRGSKGSPLRKPPPGPQAAEIRSSDSV